MLKAFQTHLFTFLCPAASLLLSSELLFRVGDDLTLNNRSQLLMSHMWMISYTYLPTFLLKKKTFFSLAVRRGSHNSANTGIYICHLKST